MQAGYPFAHELDFSTGLPTGAVVYSVLGNDNQPIAGFTSVSVTPPADAFSMMLLVPGEINTCNKPLFEVRTLTWSYLTTSGLVTGRVRYRVERLIPFPVSEQGVRDKLGLEPTELEDSAIDLLMAYGSLSAKYDLTQYENGGNYNALIVVNAIEAQAALSALPSLQLAIAKAEDSGTNKYQRFSTIDWGMLADSLNSYIYTLQSLTGTEIIVPIGTVFVAVGRSTDPLTGNDYQ